MRRSRKFILIAVLAIVVLGGSLGGVALAQTDEDTTPKFQRGAFLEKVCEIYNANTDPDIDYEALQAAFDEARSQMHPEGMPERPKMDPEAMKEAMQERLENLYNQGKLSDEQYAEMKERLESMPDDAPFGPRGHFGGFDGSGEPGGWFRGFGEPCAPQTTA